MDCTILARSNQSSIFKMAATLQARAALSVRKPSSTFYEDDKNPVYNAFAEECKLFVQYEQRRVSGGFRKKVDEPFSRGSNTLFTLWNNYQARLPEAYFQQKVIEMGDFLVTIEEYNLAVWQCYGRYLDQFGDQHIEDITDINTVVEIFFPGGLETQQASLTFRALYGKSICNYQLVLQTDQKLQNSESVTKCLKILAFLRLITQVVLPKEPLCWLVYNGTIHIYSVSRHLMTLGHSAKVLEFLLWACMCIENSVPLMSVRYLQWRTTLYTAVCQCYYDCKAPQHAETFARRALAKVNELSQLEKISSSALTAETEVKFRQAAVRLGIMVFKRSVFDARKRTKGLLRPKTRSNLKDSQSQPWPRTAVEKLLGEMFEGSAAQFLAILETLADSTRRTLLTSPAAADTEDYILDTFSELFFAGLEIISGGGGHNPRAPQSVSSVSLAGVVRGSSLMEKATSSEDGIPISAVVKFLKCAYNYEQWEVYDMVVQHAMDYIKNDNDPQLAGDLKSLEILEVMEPLNSKRKTKRSTGPSDDATVYSEPTTLPLPPSAQNTSADNLVTLAEIIFACSKSPAADMMDKDMIVDATLFLWSKCKAVFQKFQTGAIDSTKYLQRMDNPSKWVHVLSIVQEVMYWCGIGSVDPSVTAEVAIRLALVLESNATNLLNNKDASKQIGKVREADVQSESTKLDSPAPRSGKISVTSISGRDTALTGGQAGATLYTTTVLNQGPEDQLLLAREFLERALQGMSTARSAVATTDGDSIADVSWIKDQKMTDVPVTSLQDNTESSEAVHHTIMDLHLELLYMFHRVCLKLAGLLNSKKNTKAKRDISARTGQRMSASSGLRSSRADASALLSAVDTSEELVSACGKNLLSRALFNMQRALQKGSGSSPTADQKQDMEEALSFITKAQDQEQKLFVTNTQKKAGSARISGVPPAPLLVCRTDRTMVFKPAPFTPSQKVAWYRIFARPFVGSNVKVRLNDHNLPGTGDDIPAYDCELQVSGLTTNERYVFAVAAYTATGELIGGSIGDTSKPILVSHPLPILMVWAFLSQAAYQVGCYSIGLHASRVLWNHFVADIPPPESDIDNLMAKEDYKVTLKRLNPVTASVASPLLLRMFLSSIFINVDVSIREGSIYCDKLCDEGPYYSGQIQRLGECERMLVALELAGWLNESNLALQAVVQCYGLLAPLIYYKIASAPVVQILIRCYAVLQETPINLLQRRQQSTTDSLHHMLASVTFYLAKVLRTWRQRNLSNYLTDSGKKMLAVEREMEKSKTDSSQVDFIEEADSGQVIGQTALQANRRKRAKRPGGNTNLNPEGTQNEELRALEAHILKLSKLAHNTDELTGSEDPNILHAFIATLPSRYAYKEVVKFRRRARYLEFFVQVVQKALSEGLVDIATEWCDETVNWLIRRNEQLSAVKATITKQAGGMTLAGDDTKKYAAAVVEFSKNKPSEQPKPSADVKPSPRRRKKKVQLLVHLRSHLKLSDAAREEQEAREIQAFEKLEVFFGDFYRTMRRKQRLRKICSDEMPWRSHMNILQGLCHFAQFLGKIEKRNKLLGPTAGDIYRSSYLDNDWFTFDTVGTLLVGWDGGPSRSPTRQGDNGQPQHHDPIIAQLQQLDADEVGKAVTTAIEVAALATVGEPVLRVPPPPDDKVSDTLQTYHSSESEKDAKGAQPPHDISGLSSPATLDSLAKSFDYLKKAVVLAHRGCHWNLLQNACRAMWNCANTALLHCFSEGYDNSLVTVDALRGIMWKPFYMAVDCLLDMLIRLQKDDDSQTKMKKGPVEEKRQAWVGDISDEKGGASLKFETPLDDTSFIDSRWTRRLVVRVMEMLYYEQQWERLADVAMKFNMLTRERYTEHVSPVLVQAQRKLVSRVHAYGGPPPVQPHFRGPSATHNGDPITSQNYMYCQLKMEVNTAMFPPIETGGRIDPEGHNVYDSAADAFKLVSVPLDISSSLSSFREVLDQSSYTSRALQHSRKLLILYLASQQNATTSTTQGNHNTHSHVGFSETNDNPQMPTPPDMTKAEFKTVQEVQIPALPKSQLGVVVSSYDKTIEILLGRKQNNLAAQAMHELGNIHYHSGNIRVAYRWWSGALDLIMNTDDTLHSWRELVRGKKQQDISNYFLSRCGIWGCVLGAVLAAKIAQYVLTSDLGLRQDSCFLAAYLFKALFRTTLPHPTADRDYALYDIGEGCEVQYLVPGVDLLSDKFRCDGRTLVAALRWVTEELSRGRHNLMVLPLLSLYQYLTTYVCRDLQRAVDGRILKVRILTDLGLYSEAFTVLSRLLHGERLPQTADNNFRQVESKMPTQKFNTGKPLLEPINLKMLEYLLDKRLSPSLGTLYGPHLTCHLSLVQAHLMVSLAGTIHVLPDQEDVTFTPQAPLKKPPSPTSVSTHSRAPTSVISKKDKQNTPRVTLRDCVASDDEASQESVALTEDTTKKFTGGKKPLTLERIKGVLLKSAEDMLKLMVEVLHGQTFGNISAAELELITLAKLEISAIFQQHHLSVSAADIVVTAMQSLQESELFKEVKKQQVVKRPSSMRGSRQKLLSDAELNLSSDESPSQFQYQNFQSRSRLDGRLWLSCRLCLVKSLMGQVRGMGTLGGSNQRSDTPDCRTMCMEGLAEADACGDAEMQAEFFMQGALLDLQEGRDVEDVKDTLMEVMTLLENQQTLSPPGGLLHALAKIQFTDLNAITGQENDATLQAYLETHKVLLEQMMYLGEKIDQHKTNSFLSSPSSPLANLYLPHVPYLVKNKMRIGHTLARKAALISKPSSSKIPNQKLSDMWVTSASVLGTALELASVLASKDHTLIAEIMLHLGKVQCQLCYQNLGFPSRLAVKTLLDAIETSLKADQDLGLIRQAYTEIAMAYLSSSSQCQPVETPEIIDVQLEVKQEKKRKTGSAKKGSRGKAQKDVDESEFSRERKKEQYAAWVALRAATCVGDALRSQSLLIGDPQLTSTTLKEKVLNKLPEFAQQDLLGNSPVPKAPPTPHPSPIMSQLERVEEVLDSKSEGVASDVSPTTPGTRQVQVTWIHLVGYTAVLQRMCNLGTVAVGESGEATNNNSFEEAELMEHSFSQDIVRSPLFSSTTSMRLQSMIQFLITHLPYYQSCLAVPPPSLLNLPPQGTPSLNLLVQSYHGNRSNIPQISLPKRMPSLKVSEKNLTTCSENEICVQWYQPSFRVVTKNVQPGILLLYAVGKPPPKASAKSTGKTPYIIHKIELSLSDVVDLHDHLAILRQRADMSLSDNPKPVSAVAITPASGGSAGGSTKSPSRKSRRTARIAQLSAKVKKDENLEALFRQCIQTVEEMLQNQMTQEQDRMSSSAKMPFEVNLTNIQQFEQLFDPSFGDWLKGTKLFDWLISLLDVTVA